SAECCQAYDDPRRLLHSAVPLMGIEIGSGVPGSSRIHEHPTRCELFGERHRDGVQRGLGTAITKHVDAEGRAGAIDGAPERGAVAADHDDARAGRCQKQRQECLGHADRAKDVDFVSRPDVADDLFAWRAIVVRAIPALLMRTSRCEHCRERLRTAAATLSSLVTSISTHCTSSPSARSSLAARVPRPASLAPSQTLNPSAASRRTTSRPIPLLAPVTRALCAAAILKSPVLALANAVRACATPQGRPSAAHQILSRASAQESMALGRNRCNEPTSE